MREQATSHHGKNRVDDAREGHQSQQQVTVSGGLVEHCPRGLCRIVHGQRRLSTSHPSLKMHPWLENAEVSVDRIAKRPNSGGDYGGQYGENHLQETRVGLGQMLEFAIFRE